MDKENFTFIDLFAGIGGFKMALSNNGGKCIAFSEVNKDAISTYCENYGIKEKENLGDITKIEDLPKHDLLTAGVPCQSWSIAGKNLGFDDDRGQLWNDTIYLLQKSQPKAFIFENVKGLADPRNRKALLYILDKIKNAGYFTKYQVINSFDYGVPQNRQRLYIIGFKEKQFLDMFTIPMPNKEKNTLGNILGVSTNIKMPKSFGQKDLFGNIQIKKEKNSFDKDSLNAFFQFNDLRNGNTTIHSWDIIETTERQKKICLLLLKNRRKSKFGKLDGNPLSITHFKVLDASITEKELIELVELDILKEIEYEFEIIDFDESRLSENELLVLSQKRHSKLFYDDLMTSRFLKLKKVKFSKELETLKEKGVINCVKSRYEFKNKKISSGLFGINRIFLPSADAFPTLVASDTNDYITLNSLNSEDIINYRKEFLDKVYYPKNYRKLTKEEACKIQGFPSDFKLPESRARWMKLIGNSVSVPIIDILVKSIIETGAFGKENTMKFKITTKSESTLKQQDVRVSL